MSEIPRLTKEQANIIAAYTGTSCGPLVPFHEYVDKLFGSPIWAHNFASKEFWEKLKSLSEKDFASICYSDD